MSATANVPADAPEFTSILSLKAANKFLYDGIFKYQEIRPSNEVIDVLYQVTLNFWQSATENIPSYKSVLIEENKSVSDFRNREDGGSMLFRPIGIDILAEAYTSWKAEKGDTNHFWNEFTKIDASLNSEYWRDVLWDNAKKKVLTVSPKFRREYTKYLLGLIHDHDYVQIEYTKIRGGQFVDVTLIELPEKP